jgi:two-component system OmpR family response regulator
MMVHVKAGSIGPTARVLVIDDEPNIVDPISITLRHRGYLVRTAGTAIDGLDMAERWHPDVVVLDVMLPDFDGFEVARRLHADPTPSPVLFLSALDSTGDKVRGLKIGAYDYVTKPFSLEELLARLESILRRTGRLSDGPRRLAFVDLELDEETMEVYRAGEPVELTTTEFRLFRYFMLNPRRVLSRDELIAEVWGDDFTGYPRMLETYMSYLRKKIDHNNPPLLHTVRGIGYVLRLPRS